MSKPTIGHEKPRRLEDDTASYLLQMEQELETLPREDAESRSILIENVFQEIENRSASAACDRRTNFIVEKLCTEASMPQLLECMAKWTQYVIFLARNRFASHILQTLLARVTFLLKDKPDIEEEIPNIGTTICDFCTPLLHDMHWLSQEQVSSFVLRSVACLLAGVPPVAERKAKKAKHQHSVTYSLTLEEMVEPAGFAISDRFSIPLPQGLQALLLHYTDLLVQRSAHDLQLLVANVCSNAFLLLLLRVLASPNRFKESRGLELVHIFVQKTLELEEPSAYDLQSSISSGVFFGMSGDQCGSYFLEGIVPFLELPVLLGLVRGNILGSLEGFLRDGTSNFVLQAVLKRFETLLTQEQEALGPSVLSSDEPDAKKRRKDKSKMTAVATEVVQITTQIIEEIFVFTRFQQHDAMDTNNADDDDTRRPADIQRLLQERNGVLLCLLQSAIALHHLQAHITSSNDLSTYATSVAQFVLSTWSTDPMTHNNNADIAQFLSQRLLAPLKAAQAAKEAALAAQQQQKATGRPAPATPAAPAVYSGPPDMSAQALLCRLLGTLLQHPLPALALQAASLVTGLEPEALKVVATTGNLSRHVLDVYLQRFHHNNSNNQEKAVSSSSLAQPQIVKALSASLVPLATDLAGHFVGQHVVKRVFDTCDLRGKERWAQVLSPAGVVSSLQRTKEGRNTLSLVQAELYLRDAAEWRMAMKKQAKANELFRDLLQPAETTTTATNNGTTSSAGAVDGAHAKKGANLGAKKDGHDKDGDEKTKKEGNEMNEVNKVVLAKKDVTGSDNEDDHDDEEGDGDVKDQKNSAGNGGKRKRKRKRGGNKATSA